MLQPPRTQPQPGFPYPGAHPPVMNRGPPQQQPASMPQPSAGRQLQVTEHSDVIHDTQFDYYGQLLATASSDRTIGIHVATTDSPVTRIATLTGHEGPIWMVSWAHPRFGSVLASASYDQRSIIWKEVPNGSQRWMPVHVIDTHQGSVNAVQWAPEEYGPIVATASSDGTVAVTPYVGGCWQESVKVSNNSNLIAHAMGATSVSFAPFKSSMPAVVLLASGGCDSHVRLWATTMHEGQLRAFDLYQVLEGHTDWVRDVAFCPSSAATRFVVLASCGQDKTVVLYRKAWEQVAAELEVTPGGGTPTTWERSVVQFKKPVWRLSWAPAGEVLVVTTADSEVFILRESVDFTEPWISVPLSEHQKQ